MRKDVALGFHGADLGPLWESLYETGGLCRDTEKEELGLDGFFEPLDPVVPKVKFIVGFFSCMRNSRFASSRASKCTGLWI